jgi:hypothetical protein
MLLISVSPCDRSTVLQLTHPWPTCKTFNLVVHRCHAELGKRDEERDTPSRSVSPIPLRSWDGHS